MNEGISMKKSKTTTLPAIVPRNPLVAAAKFRKAGSHRDNKKTERQKARNNCNAFLKTPLMRGFYILGTLKLNFLSIAKYSQTSINITKADFLAQHL
jgi:hypothetical protein